MPFVSAVFAESMVLDALRTPGALSWKTRRMVRVLISSVVLLAACAAPASEEPPAVTPEDVPVAWGLDCHMHARPTDTAGETAAEAVAALEGAGLGRACLLSTRYHPPDGCTEGCPEQQPFTQQANDAVLAEAASRPRRLLPFCAVPLSREWAADEVERCAASGGAGLKLHLVSESLSLRDSAPAASLASVLSAAGGAGLPVLVHIDDSDADEVRTFFEIVAAAPATKVIAAHQVARNMALLLEAPTNLSIEVSGLTFVTVEQGAGFIELWRGFGIDRVLLGSDWPILDPSDHVAWLEEAALEDAERAAIVDGNGRALFPAR